jgi:hypothetical protein
MAGQETEPKTRMASTDDDAHIVRGVGSLVKYLELM